MKKARNKKKILLESASITSLTLPNLIYMLCNLKVLKEANVIALTMVALLVLSIIGLGALIHFKVKAGIWLMVIGIFVLILSNISYVSGVALLIEGAGLALDGYLIRPLIIREKIKELEANGKSVTYTRNIE